MKVSDIATKVIKEADSDGDISFAIKALVENDSDYAEHYATGNRPDLIDDFWRDIKRGLIYHWLVFPLNSLLKKRLALFAF